MEKKKVTMNDVARLAGVSQTAVSMILNQKAHHFPAETVERVQAAMKTLGYSFSGRGLSERRGVILVMVTAITNPFYSFMIQNINQVAEKQGIEIITACTYHNPQMEARYLKTAIDCHYLGVVCLYPPDNAEAYNEAQALIPTVALCNKIRRIHGDVVQIDNYEAGVLAARHLLELGHRHLAVFSDSSRSETSSSATRLRGIYEEVEKYMKREDLLVLDGVYSGRHILDEPDIHFQTGYSLASQPQILERGITGIICTNDLMAYGAMARLSEMGYRIPDDFSVIGSDNSRYSQMPQISLTTIDLHMDVIALSAFNLLLTRTSLQSNTSQERAAAAKMEIRCNADLIVRESTRRLT